MESVNTTNPDAQLGHVAIRRPPWPVRWIRTALPALCVGYLLLVITLTAIARTLGDRHVWATILLFSPRWLFLTPLIVLIPLSLGLNRRMLWWLAAGTWVCVFPLMGFCVNLPRMTSPSVGPLPLRVMSFNAHYFPRGVAGFGQYLSDVNPDVLALVETPDVLQRNLLAAPEWNVVRDGELTIASRYPIESATLIKKNVGMSCVISAPGQTVRIIAVHLTSPHWALIDAIESAPDGRAEMHWNIQTRGEEVDLLRRKIEESTMPTIVAGDFNLVSDSRLFRRGFSGLSDTFESVGLGFGWTYFNRWTCLRIDHILTNEHLIPTGFSIGPNLGSPHRPIVAELMVKRSQ